MHLYIPKRLALLELGTVFGSLGCIVGYVLAHLI